MKIKSALLFLVVVLAVAAIGYRLYVPMLVGPIVITDARAYADGGALELEVRDVHGKKYTLRREGRMSTSRGEQQFSIADHFWSVPFPHPIRKGSGAEKDIAILISVWMKENFSDNEKEALNSGNVKAYKSIDFRKLAAWDIHTWLIGRQD